MSSAPTNFKIRPARRGDAEAIRNLLDELGYSKGADSNTVGWIISHPEMEILIAADQQDKAVGLCALSHRPQLRLNGRIATIDELVVTQAWRGKGVGRALLTRATERAKVLSVKRLEILNHHGHADPREFLHKCGFTVADAIVFRYPGFEVR
jgi:N-acetylglutamate synthase-like GNAT family acetyltransferase